MELLANIYKLLGAYLFIIGLPMLSEIISEAYQLIKHREIKITFPQGCKLYLKAAFIGVFVLGYLLFLLFAADSEEKRNFIRLAASVVPIASVAGVLGCLARQKHRKQEENQKTDLKHYVIKSENFLFWYALVMIVPIVFLQIVSLLQREVLWVHLSLSAFLIFDIIFCLDMGLWKVEVNDMEIIHRSTFGRTRTYHFGEITRGVYKKSGAFRVYAGEKRIFTFDDNMEFSPFVRQMQRLQIPIDRGSC